MQASKKEEQEDLLTNQGGTAKELNQERMKKDAKYDGFKAIATTASLGVEQVLAKYRGLFEVEHSFRVLKTELEIRTMYHWTNKRIEGHIAMSFMHIPC